MNTRINLKITYRSRSALVLLVASTILASLFLLRLLWTQQIATANTHQPQTMMAAQADFAVNTGGERKYYLTQSIMQDGNEAIDACAEGYHMAAMWELLDTTQLRYNSDLGRTQPDSGQGPLTFFEGWIRTGQNDASIPTAGQANCRTWSSDSGADYGTSAFLPVDWLAGSDISVWETSTWQCSTNLPVWCMADAIDTGSRQGMRQYYLSSSDTYNGAQAAGACAGGYHMGSLWEMLDPSSLKYNTQLGDSRLDSGMGPPTVSYGWARTGYLSVNNGSAGQANCNTWSTTSGVGTNVRLATNWIDPAEQDVGVWDVGLRTCSDQGSVWCVADLIGSGTCSEALVLPEDQLVNGDTSNYSNNISTYSCSAWDETGPETIYSFVLPPGSFYTVTAEISNLASDLDVFILSSNGCGSPGDCVTTDSYGDVAATARSIPAGIYYVAVDGFTGNQSVYSVSLTVSSLIAQKVYIPSVMRMN